MEKNRIVEMLQLRESNVNKKIGVVDKNTCNWAKIYFIFYNCNETYIGLKEKVKIAL